MQEIIIALITGFLIGHILNRLISFIAHYIHKKEAFAEIGAISCSKKTRASLFWDLSENSKTAFWQGCQYFFFKSGWYDKSVSRRSTDIALISTLFTGIVVWHFGVTFAGLAALLCLYFLILLGFIDSETGYLPDCLTGPFLWVGLLVNTKSTFVALHTAVISAVSVYLLCKMVNASFRSVTGKDGMGQGDFKMMAALGAWFGWVALIIIVIMASLLAILAGLIRMVSGRQGFKEYFPFGPYLAVAAVPVLLYGSILMQTLNDFS